MTECTGWEIVDVLLVEDDPGDILMTREAFEHHKIQNKLHVVTDGEQALQFLHQTGEYADAPRPGLILLDLNLHANAYVSKPVDFERFMDVIRQIDSFFVTVVKLPH